MTTTETRATMNLPPRRQAETPGSNSQGASRVFPFVGAGQSEGGLEAVTNPRPAPPTLLGQATHLPVAEAKPSQQTKLNDAPHGGV